METDQKIMIAISFTGAVLAFILAMVSFYYAIRSGAHINNACGKKNNIIQMMCLPPRYWKWKQK